MEQLDYASHYLEANKKMKEANELILKKKFMEAASKIDEAIVELRLMRGAVKTHAKD